MKLTVRLTDRQHYERQTDRQHYERQTYRQHYERQTASAIDRSQYGLWQELPLLGEDPEEEDSDDGATLLGEFLPTRQGKGETQ